VFLGSLTFILKGFTTAMVVWVVARIVLYSYYQYTYLFQWEAFQRSTERDDELRRLYRSWLTFILPLARRVGHLPYRKLVERKLPQAGYPSDFTVDHFIADQILWGGVTLLLMSLFCFLLEISFGLGPLLGAVVGLIRYLRLSDMAYTRGRTVNRDLPFFMDYLALAMNAGLDFNRALEKVIEDAPASPLSDEFTQVIRAIGLGKSRGDALSLLATRLHSPQITVVVQTLREAMRLGSDVSDTLVALSQSLRERHFEAAEEKAGKISVQMMIPMLVFVMPATVIILLGPMLLEWMDKSL
jgi:tight adherence protein C